MPHHEQLEHHDGDHRDDGHGDGTDDRDNHPDDLDDSPDGELDRASAGAPPAGFNLIGAASRLS